jgi:hypothetical protein
MRCGAVRAIVLLVCGVVLCAGASVAAGTKSHQVTPELAAVIEAYGLRVVDRSPEGVKPVSVASVAQLEQLLESIDAAGQAVVGSLSVGPVVRPMSGWICRPYHWRSGGLVYQYNLDANVYIQNYGSFTWIDHISAVRFYLSGVTLGVYLTDVWTDAAIDPSNHQCATVSGGATECWYIILKGVLTYYERPCAMYRDIDVSH